MKKLKIDNKHLFILFNISGVVIFLLGGAKLLAIITALIMGFLIGKYLEKVFQIVKDYRLMQKVNKINYSQIEIENIKKENEELKNLILRINRTQNTNVPPVKQSNIYDELEKFEYNPKINY
ncbi:hypothetical protein [Paramaledivibacter caminithermalis]|jgi:hypothetical protein|uniref:Uncharacterized protein n=1 Tax=Paramaledivibacter caminithermalis (strain DSM 15212 / CIP 107654 / DViRD3) TaxID=1121301 RepID=A0A1M6K5Y7_PARC5|nr:hypothetical protein [Paramaledivibacter caminithermalis]SHJ54404.1 hypothetical protein SAMN02745912_00280 [Paramaledivibacter caminithermalis DSM 15212]